MQGFVTPQEWILMPLDLRDGLLHRQLSQRRDLSAAPGEVAGAPGVVVSSLRPADPVLRQYAVGVVARAAGQVPPVQGADLAALLHRGAADRARSFWVCILPIFTPTCGRACTLRGPGLSILSILSCFPLLSRHPASTWSFGSFRCRSAGLSRPRGRDWLGRRRVHDQSASAPDLFDSAGRVARRRGPWHWGPRWDWA